MDLIAVEVDFIIQAVDLPIHAHAHESRLTNLFKHRLVSALPPADDRRQDQQPGAIGHARDEIYNFLGGLAGDLAPANRAVRDPHPRIQQADVIVNLSNRPDRRAGIARSRFLVDGNRRRKPFDGFYFRFFHLPQELAGIGRKRFDVPPLPFGENGIECQGRFA